MENRYAVQNDDIYEAVEKGIWASVNSQMLFVVVDAVL